MSSGFNTDVTRGECVFHVQTEDRGPQHPSIDTVVYRNGRILHRHSVSYADVAQAPNFSAEALKARVETQHREIIEGLRSGTLDSQIAAADAEGVRTAGIQVQLLNPEAWLAVGKVSLQIGIIRRANKEPVSGANVEASIAGALNDPPHRATSDAHGRATIEFDLPPLGKGDLALVIEARSESLKDELRYAMRSRPKTSQPEAPQ
jgi:hypothetical protein